MSEAQKLEIIELAKRAESDMRSMEYHVGNWTTYADHKYRCESNARKAFHLAKAISKQGK